MSLKYRMEVEKGPIDMREWSKRPGKKDEHGNILYFTEQHHKKECDINEIIKKYDKFGVITHVQKFKAEFGEYPATEFKEMVDVIANANSSFMLLPSKIRNRFKNDPSKLLEFMENGENRDEAIRLGLIKQVWTPDTDGIGEKYQKDKENIVAEDIGN